MIARPVWLIFQERQIQVLEDHRRDLVDVHLGFVIILPRTVAGLSGALPLSLLIFTRDHIADFGVAIALPDVFALAVIESELVFVQRAHRHFDLLPPVRQDDRFVRDDRAEIFADRFLDALFVAILVDDAFALKRPVVALD